MSKVHPEVEEAVDTLDLNPVTRRRLLAGTGLVSASLAASALLAACSNDDATSSDRRARGRQLPEDAEVEVRLRLPRHHQPVLHAHPVRRRGRVQAARLRSTSGPARRTRSWPRWSTPPTPRSAAKADGIAIAVVDKTAFNGAGRPGAGRRHPGRLVQRRRRPGRPGHQPAGLHRPGPVRVRVRAGPAGADPGWTPATWSASSPRPGQLNIQPRIDGAQQAFKDSGKPVTFTAVGDQRRRHQGSVHHRRLRPGPPQPGRDAGRGRRLDPGGRPDGGEVQDCATRA